METKAALLAACLRRGIPVLASAGAGGRADPTRLCFADISECSIDALSRSVRHRLRHAHHVDSGVPVLFSSEKPRCGLLPLDLAPGQCPQDLQVIPNFRIRTIPVLGALPAAFGLAMAAYALTSLAGAPLPHCPPLRFRAEEVAALHSRLLQAEEMRGVGAEGARVGLDEVHWLLRELYQGQSARDGIGRPDGVAAKGAKGLWRPTGNLVLTRWDASREAGADNLVLLTFAEAEAHERETLAELGEREPRFVAKVEAALKRAAREFGIAPWEEGPGLAQGALGATGRGVAEA